MALIDCPECSTQVSSAALSCPTCGFPIASSTAKRGHPEAADEPVLRDGGPVLGDDDPRNFPGSREPEERRRVAPTPPASTARVTHDAKTLFRGLGYFVLFIVVTIIIAGTNSAVLAALSITLAVVSIIAIAIKRPPKLREVFSVHPGLVVSLVSAMVVGGAAAGAGAKQARERQAAEAAEKAREEAARVEEAERQAALASKARAAGTQILDEVSKARAAIDRADWSGAESAVTSAEEVLRHFQDSGQQELVSAEATAGLAAIAAEVRTHHRKEEAALVQEKMDPLLQEATEARSAGRWDDASTAVEEAMGLLVGYEESGGESFIADETKTQAELLAADIRGYFERKEATEAAEEAMTGPAAYRCDGTYQDLVAHWETVQQHAEYAPRKANKLQQKLEACRKKQVREYKAAFRSVMQTGREFNRDQWEKGALSLGLDFDFAIVGQRTLRVKYALFSKAFVYKLTNGYSRSEGELLHTYQEGGFSRVIFTDGWGFRLAFDLDPPDEGAILREQLQEFGIAEPFVL